MALSDESDGSDKWDKSDDYDDALSDNMPPPVVVEEGWDRVILLSLLCF